MWIIIVNVRIGEERRNNKIVFNNQPTLEKMIEETEEKGIY